MRPLILKINFVIDRLHNHYLRLKNGFLVVFCLSFLLLACLSQQVKGESVVPTITTKVSYTAGAKTTTFTTTENTLGNALEKQGIILAKNDITSPDLDTPLVGEDISAKLIPAVPVLINDNGQSWVGQSAYTDIPGILSQLKVNYDKADIITKELILDPATENMAGQMITIKRAPVYTVSVDDKEVIVHSWAQTVTNVLRDGGITLNQNDSTDPDRLAPAPSSGHIIVTRVNYADIEETVTIVYQTINQDNYEMYQGQSRVTQGGVNGSKRQSVHIVYHNGVEVSREVTASEVLASPQNKVIEIGVKPYGIDDLWPIIVAASNQYGIDAGKMARVMMCESHANVYSQSPYGYYGLFQWDGSLYSWAARAGHPASNMYDVNAQIYATALRVSQNGWGAWGGCSGA